MLTTSPVEIVRREFQAPPILRGGRMMSPAGEIAQIVNGADEYRYIAYLEFRPDAFTSRGNHYHADKVESLYVMQGSLQAVYEDLDNGERHYATLEAGDFVTVYPRCAHAYIALEHSHAIEFSPQAYDPADTIHYSLPTPAH